MKILYIGFFLLTPLLSLIAQETEKDTIEQHNFNRWSLELNVGQNRVASPFADGYYATKPNTYFNFNGIQHYNVGVRYMISNVFGVKLDFAYDIIKNKSGSGSLEFETRQSRIGLQGVANLGRLLRFETFTHRIGLLAHGGFQVSTLHPTIGVNKNLTERDWGFIYGLSPQCRMNDWLVITGDITGLNNFRQHLNWDGSSSDDKNNLLGSMLNYSVGVTVYFGDSSKKHADWYVPEPPVAKTDEETIKRIASIETLMNDTDKDGVPDYLDSENNTPAGVAVDTRGKFIDINKNGVPDEMERKSTTRIDQKFNIDDNTGSTNSNKDSGHALSVLKSLVESGNVNIFFDVNKDTPNSGSSNSVQQLYQYLMKYPQSKIKLNGFADMRGDEAKNKDLSERRAQKLKDFFVAAGINESRIIIGGQGVDKMFSTDSDPGLNLARRVSIEIINN